MDEMMKVISKYDNGTYLKVKWEKEQLVIGGIIDTIYESDNGLDEDEMGYKEFFACAFKIKEIFNNSSNMGYEVESLIEISVENQPTQIMLEDGNIIWEN